MHSVLEGDKEKIDDGKLINEALNHNINSFVPDMMFEKMVQNYKVAEQIFGEKILRMISGYDPSYVQKNLGIPEFKKELLQNMENKIDQMKKDKFLDRKGRISERGVYLASLILYTEELDKLMPKGFGEKQFKKLSHYGEKGETKTYARGDRYKDINIRKTLRKAMRRGHKNLAQSDLTISKRNSKGTIHLIYGMDASGSMKGSKIETAKRAGVALAFKAISEKDKVGLITFGAEIKSFIPPTLDFPHLLREMTRIKAARETDFEAVIKKSTELFPTGNQTKHLIILTDAMPTVGDEPEKKTLEAVSIARANNITISVVGIDLTEGKELAKKIARLGQGRLFLANSSEDIDQIILQDYFALQAE